MPKVKVVNNSEKNQQVWFVCPGCKDHHAFTTKNGSGGPAWDWNGDIENPTFSPSLMCNRGQSDQCHSVVTNGKINFCSDCHHELKGQTVDIPEIDDFLKKI